MAFTKINFYIGFLLCYIMIVSTSMLFMQEQITTDIAYSNDTVDYVTNFVDQVENTGIDTVYNQNASELNDDSIVTETNETGEFSVTDTLANINFYSSRVAKIGAYIKLVYNAPTFIMYSLGIGEYNEMKHILNIFGVILFISVLILLIRQIRGS